MDIMSLVIQLVVGAIGGNAGGAVMKDKSLGTLGNTIAGAVGGFGGSTILGSLMNSGAVDAVATQAAGGGFDLNNILGGGVGGLVLSVVAGLIKNAMAKPA
jgi:uncharacterized membrane protein YeaQ/YmgE (transglycosylase-associated protein family)